MDEHNFMFRLVSIIATVTFGLITLKLFVPTIYTWWIVTIPAIAFYALIAIMLFLYIGLEAVLKWKEKRRIKKDFPIAY